ncbi:MAG: hypothetical protein ABL931_02030 [Usitatibacteraceae bacterium]|jgi:hypothetical protein
MGSSRMTIPSNVRFAVWDCHGKKCWMCNEPLRLLHSQTDHVVPTSLRNQPEALSSVIKTLGLPISFDIDGFANLLPSCAPCNRRKSDQTFEATPQIRLILSKLDAKASWVERTAAKVKQDVSTDRVLKAIFSALENGKMSMADIEKFLIDVIRTPDQLGVPDDVLILSDGFWRKRDTIVAEGFCRCERNHCVGTDTKVFCYFHYGLSQWVINSGLYAACYDELVNCSRCNCLHKRGHIGFSGTCGNPYANQKTRSD